MMPVIIKSPDNVFVCTNELRQVRDQPSSQAHAGSLQGSAKGWQGRDPMHCKGHPQEDQADRFGRRSSESGRDRLGRHAR